MKINIKKFLVSIHNSFISFVFFFWLRNLYLNLFPGQKVALNSSIHSKVYFYDFGNLHIGSNVTVNYSCYIDNRAGVFIGNNVNISHSCQIYSMGHDINDPLASLTKQPVYIADNAWLFPNCSVMPGVKIGEGAVLYPGSVVTRDVPAYTVVGGNPAKVIGERNKNIQYLINNKVWFSR